jgi:hypothetical protein
LGLLCQDRLQKDPLEQTSCPGSARKRNDFGSNTGQLQKALLDSQILLLVVFEANWSVHELFVS